ncbi:MAG: hypothetical protein LBQ68_08215 [Clostridiales bacterium]|jgi:hypothetical protein|nr:hypothetical protein [Clostridiales bacterium]
MKKIKLMFDYECYPIWIYKESGELENNALPFELASNNIIKSLLEDLQKQYENLFINTATMFEYRGFQSQSIKEEFQQSINNVVSLMREALGNNYIIEVADLYGK